MKSIFLIGFMGSGKTSVSKALANILHINVIDTDELLEKTYETTISDIFAEKGEDVFRKYETSILKQAPTANTIVSTGGGIVEREENIDWLINNGSVVYLETGWETIVTRLKEDTTRPIWNNAGRDKQKLLEERDLKYKRTADVIVQTDGKSPDMIASEILGVLNL
ncbi:shikimate kinase [Aquibacillus koreensis]|uniref:Shikimate kinase n=1 Tax=Aquibacillus koreensis TaxID=279446 RepID=A0A9X4AGI8_9BACI|nr:shikimate kinase [Aquibacillus koreensis]MCT2537545.1 shikimate kinase [Aquibacillus koreensis]MDC3418991.1 shikimate kinase [Aquibacillus koreensis]